MAGDANALTPATAETAADSAALYIIATADGLQGIDAVYGARAMLGLDPAANDAQEKTAILMINRW